MARGPSNGPTFTKAPPKKRKPMSDTELAEFHSRKDAAHAETVRKAAKSRQILKTLHRDGVFAAFPNLANGGWQKPKG